MFRAGQWRVRWFRVASAALADVNAGRADLVVVPSVERLGFGRQVFERIAAVRAAGGDIAGPGVRIDADGTVVAMATTDQM